MADFTITFSLTHTINEVMNALNEAMAIQTALQNSSVDQQANLKQIIEVLEDAQERLAAPSCPNGMLFTFTIDEGALASIGKAKG